MKDDEKVFFKVCYVILSTSTLCIRDVVNMFTGVMHHKRCWYLLKKWSRLGFYDYGVTLDLGWFCTQEIPYQYKQLIYEIC